MEQAQQAWDAGDGGRPRLYSLQGEHSSSWQRRRVHFLHHRTRIQQLIASVTRKRALLDFRYMRSSFFNSSPEIGCRPVSCRHNTHIQTLRTCSHAAGLTGTPASGAHLQVLLYQPLLKHVAISCADRLLWNIARNCAHVRKANPQSVIRALAQQMADNIL